MIKVFNTLSEYNTYVEGGLVSGDLYYVKEDDSVHFQTNNIDGELAVYDFAPDSGESEFVPVLVDATFTANGTYDPADYEATGFDTVTVNVAAPVSTDTKITIGFRNTGNLYGIRDLNGDNDSGNFYLGNTNLGTVATSSNSPVDMSGSYMYLQMDGQLMTTPDPDFLNESEITWIKLNGVKEHIFAELPQSLEIPISFTALSKDGVSAPIFGHTSITLPSNIEGKNCILVYDFIPDTTNNTYFTLSADNSFIL